MGSEDASYLANNWLVTGRTQALGLCVDSLLAEVRL